MDVKTKDTTEFFNAINTDLAKQVKEITSNADRYYAKTIKAAKSAAAKESRTILNNENARMKRLTGRKISALTEKSKRDVYENLLDIADKVFDRVIEKIGAFTESADYADFIKESAKQTAKIIKADDAVVCVRKEDMKYADLIKDCFGGHAAVEADSSIKLGGIKAASASLRLAANDTLDARLEEQKTMFFEKFESTVSGKR